MITIPMTSTMFQKVKAELKASPEVSTHTEDTDSVGTFATPQVSMAYTYLPNTSVLNLTVLAKHGIARFASEDTIKGKLLDLLKTA